MKYGLASVIACLPMVAGLLRADGLSSNDPSLSAAHRASLHAVRPVYGEGAAWELRNPANGLTSRFDGAGMSVQVEVRQAEGTAERRSFRWEAVSVGYGENLAPVGRGVVGIDSVATNRVEIRRAHLVEWYVNRANGLEHGFTLEQRLAVGEEGAPLRIKMRLEGDVLAKVSSDGKSVVLKDREGAEALRYDKLKVWDSLGRVMKSRMTGGGREIALEVDDSQALYPLTIDPLITQQAYLKASNTEPGDLFGSAVAIDGDTVVVGAPEESSISDSSGAVYVYKRSGPTWVEEAYLKAGNAGLGDKFGTSVSISGDSLIVGAPFENGGAGDAGAAYVFVRNGSTWSQQAYLKAGNAGASDQFGTAVSISGETVLVGAPLEDNAAGAAYVFLRNGTNWSQQAYLKASNSEAGDRFGNVVSISGETAAVGAANEDGGASGINGVVDNNKPESGAAYVFLRTGSAWSQQAYVKASNPDDADAFGSSVSLNGDTLAVGAPHEDSIAADVNGNEASNGPPGTNGASSGAAYVFLRSGTSWSQQAYVKAQNPGEIDKFGTSLSVNGNLLVVGSLNESSNATGINGNVNNEDALDAGAAYVYVRDGVSWTREAYLKASNTNAFDNFGKSVAVSGDTIVVGAFREDSNATGVNGNESNDGEIDSGAAYVFLGEGDGFGVRELWGAGPELSENEAGNLPAEEDGVNATSPAWSYGHRSTFLGTALTVFTPAQHQNGIGHSDVDGWVPNAGVLVNKGVAPAVLSLSGETTIPVLPGQIILKPATGAFPVVRWTAPEAGTYNIAARWVDLDNSVGNGAAAHVVVNGVEVFGELSGYSETSEPTFGGLAWGNGLGAAMPPQSYPLQAGDVVDFVVGPSGDSAGDLTAFNAVVCRAPSVTISAPATITVGSPLNVTATLGAGTELLGACLRLNGEPVATDLTAPYAFVLPSLTPGEHHLQVESINTGRVLGASNVVTVTVDAAAPSPEESEGDGEIAETSAAGDVYDCIVSGFWDEQDIWRRRGDNAEGVPGPNDVAVLPRSVQVVLRGNVTVAKVYLEGRIRGDAPVNARQLIVNEHFSTHGLLADLTLTNPAGGLITNVKGAAFFENVDLVNNGRMYLTKSLYSTDSALTSSGEFTLVNAPASGGPIRFGIGTANLQGIYEIGPGAAIAAGQLVAAGAGNLLPGFGPGLVGQDGGTLVGQDGSTLVGQDGGTLVGNDGGSLVGQDGSTLVGQDGSTLIGNDSAGLIGNDSAGLISDNAAVLVGNDGASLLQTGAAGLISDNGHIFSAGTLGGSGNLVGNVSNTGATFRPGSSPGFLYVRGSYTQGPGATLFLEIGGTSLENPREFDQLAVSGEAVLGGSLVVDTIDGYEPQEGDEVQAIYFESSSGSFASVSSNANIDFGPNGMMLSVDGPLGGGTPTISVAASASRLKEGKGTTFTISAPPGTARPVSVMFAMSGKAKLGGDYTLGTGARIVVIPAGRDSASITIKTKKDKLSEKTETAVMTILPAAGYNLAARPSATVSILNVKPK